MPQHTLIWLLRKEDRASYEQRQWLVSNITDGKYDGTSAEADEWAASDEGREAFGALRRGAEGTR